MKLNIPYIALFIIFFVLVYLSLNLGSIDLNWSEFQNGNPEMQTIFKYRLYRMVASILVGVALPVSGMLLQEYFKNVLAGPSILGISSSAGLGVALLLFLGFPTISVLEQNDLWQNLKLAFAGIAGALLCMFLLFSLSKFMLDASQFIIIGFLISALAGAIIALLEFYGDSVTLQQYVMWTFGKLSGLSSVQVSIMAGLTFVGLIIAFWTLKFLQGNIIGTMYAQSVGVDLQKMKIGVLLSTSILTATVTSFIGPIAFIGIIVPFFTRSRISEAHLYQQYFLNIALGIILMLALNIFTISLQLPINIITSFIGIPLIAYILLQSSRK